MPWYQNTFRLPRFERGFHLITHTIESNMPEIQKIKIGLAHVFIHHTSAALTINENADPTVRLDFEEHFTRAVPENAPYYKHNYEGSDDMPAHIKASLLGNSVTIPITNGRLNLGTWQGVYLCEHRNHASGPKCCLQCVSYFVDNGYCAIAGNNTKSSRLENQYLYEPF